MLNLDPATERGLIMAALSAGTVYGVLKATVPALKRHLGNLQSQVDRMQRTLDKLTMAHKIHHKESVNGDNA